MSTRLINRDSLLAIERRILSLLNTDNTFKEFVDNSSAIFSSSVTRLSLESLEMKSKIETLQIDIFDRLNAIENHEIYLTLADELTRLTNYYYEHENILHDIINKSSADINILQENISHHQDRLKFIEYSLSKLMSAPVTSSVIGSSNVVRITTSYKANSFDYIISNGSAVNIELPLIKNTGDIISVININESPVSINTNLFTINGYETINLICYKDDIWLPISNNENSNYEIITADYQINDTDKTKVLFIDSTTEITLTLPNLPCHNQQITFVNSKPAVNFKIRSNNFNISNLDITNELIINGTSITLVYDGIRWSIISNSSNPVVVSDNYKLTDDNQTLLIFQTNKSFEIQLPKNPPQLFTTTIVDANGVFSIYPCRLLTHNPIHGGTSEDVYLDIDIDNISINLQFIDGKWLIKS